MESIGRRLVADGMIEPAQLAWALARQRREGGDIGRHLVAGGFLSSADYHAALARHWRDETRDLAERPPHPDLLAQLDVEEMIQLGWVACDLVDDTVVVATCVRPAEDVLVEVEEHFPGKSIEFVACSPADLDTVALEVRRSRQPQGGDSSPPLPSLVRPVHHLVTGGLLLAMVVAAFVVPPTLLAVVVLAACAVFVGAGFSQALVGHRALTGDLDDGAGAGATRSPAVSDPLATDDQDLPVYTAIVRLRGGDLAVAALLDNFTHLDYPRSRTDAILLVADDDEATLDALRRTTPLPWIRVARVPAADFADVVRSCDHGLALARGRYVVAYEQDETPAPDQVRRAVAAFEADLISRIEGRSVRPPLVGLRVAHRAGRRVTPFSRLSATDRVFGFDRPELAQPGSHRAPEITSVHCHMRLLRRSGGFAALAGQETSGDRDPAPRAPRIDDLESTSVRDAVPGPGRWTRDRAEGFAAALKRVPAPMSVSVLPTATGGVAMFLAYPVVLLGTLATAVRAGGEGVAGKAAWLGLGSLVIVVAVAVAASWVLLARRAGWRAGIDALALPVHWILHGALAWVALVAVLGSVVRRRGGLNRA